MKDEFFDRIKDGEWLADVALPLCVAILAIFAAFLGIRYQIRHDRRLAEAATRAIAARAFGVKASTVASRIVWLSADDPSWRDSEWSPREIIQAWNEALIQFPEADSFKEITYGARDLAYVWRACQKRLRELESNGAVYSNPEVSTAMMFTINRILGDFYNAGKLLSRWNGLLPPPRVTWRHFHVPFPREAKKEAYERWINFYVNRFENQLNLKETKPTYWELIGE